MTRPTDEQTINLLRKVPYFADLSSDELAVVATRLVARQLQAGQVAFLEGETSAGLHLVVSGLAKIYRLSPEGREQVLALLRPGDSCNEVPVVDGGRNPASCVAVENTTFWIWPGAEMDRLRRELPRLNEAVISGLAARCRELVDKVYTLSFLPVSARLARFLLQQVAAGTTLDRRRWTQGEIAAHVGTVREMVARALRNLQDEGLVSVTRNRIEIVDRDGLGDLF